MKIAIYIILGMLIGQCILIGCSKFKGPQGDVGPSCVVKSVDGGATVTCPDGSQSFIPNGIPGASGPQGIPGGLNVTVVPLCPGTTTYPTTFIEVAFCVSDKLYAIYSYNNGFETEIVPGYYNSNAVGSSCNFTVLPHCQIVH